VSSPGTAPADASIFRSRFVLIYTALAGLATGERAKVFQIKRHFQLRPASAVTLRSSVNI
jgi:hypothetical protein